MRLPAWGLRWLEDAPSAPAYLKRLRVASEPRLKARLDLATEYNYQAVNDGNVFVRGSKVVDLNQVNGDQTVTLKKTYDFLPSKQKNWVESPLKPDEVSARFIKLKSASPACT